MKERYLRILSLFHVMILSGGIVLILGAKFGYLSFSKIDFIFAENSFFEILTIIFLLVCTLSLIGHRKWAGIISFFLLLEETSYAQSFFNYKTPELIKKINVQEELNIHNLRLYGDLDISEALMVLMLAYLILNSLFGGFLNLAKWFIINRRSSFKLLVIFAISYLIEIDNGTSPAEEVYEFSFSYYFLVCSLLVDKNLNQDLVS